MESYVGKAVKFQHRVATGHSILGPAFTVESKNPLAAPDDPPSSQTVKKDFRHFKPVPTQLVVDDALVLAESYAPGSDAPRVMLIHGNGINVMGADWHNAVSPAHDIPHRSHEGAEAGERFWWHASEDSATGNSAEPPAPQTEAHSDQNADAANGQQDTQPVAGVAGQVQGEKPDAPDAAPQVAGNAAEVNEAPSPEQPAQ